MSGKWRDHPKLKGRFLAGHPDDLQVCIHDGGPRITRNAPEVVWVTVTGLSGDVFHGRVLNQPNNLKSVHRGETIKFIVAEGTEFPVMVTDKYLEEREHWGIRPCDKCGLSELFDAPSDLIRVIFPNQPADAEMMKFTTFSPLCGGILIAKTRRKQQSSADKKDNHPPKAKRPWWRFWQ